MYNITMLRINKVSPATGQTTDELAGDFGDLPGGQCCAPGERWWRLELEGWERWRDTDSLGRAQWEDGSVVAMVRAGKGWWLDLGHLQLGDPRWGSEVGGRYVGRKVKGSGLDINVRPS